MKRYYTIDMQVCKDSGLSLQEWCMLENIHFTSVDDGWCSKTRKSLSEHHGITARNMQKHIANLVEEGWLRKNKSNHLKTTKKWTNLMGVENDTGGVSQSSDEGCRKVPTLPIEKEYKRESKPTLIEITSYIVSKNLSVDANKFFDYFEAGNWVDSKGNKVKNWKQKILTWDNHTKPVKKEKVQLWG